MIQRWLIGLLFITGTVFAQTPITKVIELQYIPANQVIQLIKPLMQPGEKVSGSGQTLVVSVSPETLTQVRAVVHQLDVPPVTFKVSISQGKPNAMKSNDIVYSTKPQSEMQRTQSVTVMNGASAMISTGTEVPIITSVGAGYFGGPLQDVTEGTPNGANNANRNMNPNNPNNFNNMDNGFISYEQHNIENGLLVRPVLQGSQVKLSVKRMREQQNAAGGQQFDNQHLNTTVMVPLNKWVPLGTAEGEEDTDNSSTSYSAGKPFSQNSTLYIKITIVNSLPGTGH